MNGSSSDQRSTAGAAQLISVADIESLLEDRIEALVNDVFPNARKEGHEMCVGSLAGEPGQSLRINVGSGSKCGWWRDFSSTEGGDALNLVRDALFAGDIGKAVAWSKGWLGLDDSDPARLEQRRVEARARAEQRDEAAIAERKKARERAVKRWHQASRITVNDPVYQYLAGRAIDWQALGRFPGAMRYHEKLHYGFGDDARILPAMVWMITSLAAEHIATHRTWLAEDENGWRKADERELGRKANGRPKDNKKVMGFYWGGHIPVWKGEQSCPLRDIKPGTDVYMSEGAEDGLTAASADPSIRVVAMIAVGNLINIELPPQMGRLLILKQNDPPGSDAAKMLARGVSHHRSQGRKVLFIETPKAVKDLNDLAQLGAQTSPPQNESIVNE